MTTPGTTPLLSLAGVTKRYGTGAAAFQALRGVDLDVDAGEFVAVMGPSGSGKSTAMNILGCLDVPTAGHYLFRGVPVGSLDRDQRARLRRKYLGFVFQGFNLLARTSAIENVELPLLYRGEPAASRHAAARRALAEVGLQGWELHTPAELSGGQQQRVAIARALANDPPIIIADEPTGNLDSKTAESMFVLFNDLVAKGKTIIIVTHDSAMAKRTHRTALIADGEIVNEYVAKAMPTLNHTQLLQATKLAELLTFEAGAMILSEGTNADTFYIVTHGTVEVVLPRPNQSDVVALQLGPGKVFGEMEFFHEKKHRASIRASEAGPVEALAITYEKLSELLEQSEVTREALKEMASKHNGENLSWRGVSS